MVFEQYPDHVVDYVTNPRTGIQRTSKFPPTISEIVAACDARVADIKRKERFQNWGNNEPLIEGPKQEKPTLEELKEKYGPNWGIVRDEPKKPIVRAPDMEEIRRHYQNFDLGFQRRDGHDG